MIFKLKSEIDCFQEHALKSPNEKQKQCWREEQEEDKEEEEDNHGQTEGGGRHLPYLLCREYLPLIWPEPLHPGVGQLDGWMEVRDMLKDTRCILVPESRSSDQPGSTRFTCRPRTHEHMHEKTTPHTPNPDPYQSDRMHEAGGGT